jgi:hypothetical protein
MCVVLDTGEGARSCKGSLALSHLVDFGDGVVVQKAKSNEASTLLHIQRFSQIHCIEIAASIRSHRRVEMCEKMAWCVVGGWGSELHKSKSEL